MEFGTESFCAAAIDRGHVLGLSQSAPARPTRRIVIEHQGVERIATLHRPTVAVKTGPAPLIVALHGLGQSIESLHDWLHLDAAAEHAGFAVVYPEAIEPQSGTTAARSKDPQPTVNGKTGGRRRLHPECTDRRPLSR